MNISDPKMLKKMERALRFNDYMLDLDDIQYGLDTGEMQGHVIGDTWAITQVHNWPRQKSVNILFVVGNLEEALKLEDKITTWAKEIGATVLTGIGRDGWWESRTPGWRKVGTLFAKDI
jgi:hypothetical protein